MNYRFFLLSVLLLLLLLHVQPYGATTATTAAAAAAAREAVEDGGGRVHDGREDTASSSTLAFASSLDDGDDDDASHHHYHNNNNNDNNNVNQYYPQKRQGGRGDTTAGTRTTVASTAAVQASSTLELFLPSLEDLNAPLQWAPPLYPTEVLALARNHSLAPYAKRQAARVYLNITNVVPMWAAATATTTTTTTTEGEAVTDTQRNKNVLTGLTTFPVALAQQSQQQHVQLLLAAEDAEALVAASSTTQKQPPSSAAADGGGGGGHRPDASWYATSSSCTVRDGCPHTAMAHASGTFTFSHLLTYHSFVRYERLTAPGVAGGSDGGEYGETTAKTVEDANAFSLSLKLSLCCNYLFHGAMLRNDTLYNHFLTVLLEASPFHVLTIDEKRLLFPKEKAVLLRTSLEYAHLAKGPASVARSGEATSNKQAEGGERVPIHNNHRDRQHRARPAFYDVFDSTYRAGSHATNADGDGNVLLLFTGRVPKAGMDRVREVLQAARAASSIHGDPPPPATASSPTVTPNNNNNNIKEDSLDGQRTNVDSTSHLSDSGIQLKITNQVLKCKCPHTLLVMPQLRMTRDALPPRMRLVGAGPHCGVRPVTAAARPVEKHYLVRVRAPHPSTASAENSSTVSSNHLLPGMYTRLFNLSAYHFATSFTIAPPPPPSSQLTWVVYRLRSAPPRDHPHAMPPHRKKEAQDVFSWETAEGRGGGWEKLPRVEVLRHQRVLPAVLDPLRPQMLLSDDGAAPYFTVEPNTYYEMEVTVRRGTEVAPQVLRGRFLLRLPFPRHWPLTSAAPQPHFGVTRLLPLSSLVTLQQAEVRAGLDPSYVPAAAATKGQQPHPLRPPNVLDYTGYWVNTAAETGDVAAARKQQVLYNPFLEEGYVRQQQQQQQRRDAAAAAAPFPYVGAAVDLHMGRNVLAYWVQDADEVCDPVALEDLEVWSVQAVLLTASPATACTDRAEVEALLVRHLLRDMRQCPAHFAVNIPQTRWTTTEAEEGREGAFRCRVRRERRPGSGGGNTEVVAYDGTCTSTPTLVGGLSGTTATLRLPSSGVYDVDWLLVVAVRDAALVVAANLDRGRARVLQTVEVVDERTGRTVNETHVEIRSSLLHIVRRVPRYPAQVTVDLPMHYRRWQLQPPPPERGTSGVSGAPPTGYWVARRPLALLSVDERLEVLLDTHDVPNVQRTLPEGTLQYIAQDPGEELALAHHLAYTSRCPDMTVEYVVRVVALKAPPPLPALELLYTEESCVAVPAPRPPQKDEAVTWHVPPCGAASRPPRMVEVPQEGAASTWRACGIEAYRPCEVVWTATNLVGAVTKTFSLHRCQRPPTLLFHADGLQRDEGLPAEVYGPLPEIEELSVQQQGVARRRSVLPVAGYANTMGFSYNTTGPQRFFEVEVAPAPGGRAANQLVHSQLFFVRREDGVVEPPLLWRAREYVDLSAAASAAAAAGAQEDTEAFDLLFGYGGPGSRSSSGDAVEGEAAQLPPVHWLEQRSRARREKDRALDEAINHEFQLQLATGARRLHAPVLHNSSFYPFDYTTRTAHGLREATAADRREFERRRMCVARTVHAALLAINPRGLVEEDERYGGGAAALFPPPPPPAVAVLPFCAPRYVFSRHVDLHLRYQYDFTWRCEEAQVIRAEKLDETLSVLHHEEAGANPTGRPENHNATNCVLRVENHLTRTAQEDVFLVQRVYPTQLGASHFIVLSENAATTVVVPYHYKSDSNAKHNNKSGGAPSASRDRVRRGDGSNEHGNRTKTIPAVGRADSPRARRVVGKSVVLHVDRPALPHRADWQVLDVTPAVADPSGRQHLLDAVHFVPLRHHPAALARGRGGATALVRGLDTPGLYTIAHHQPDPHYPDVCPNVTVVETLQVFHAQVREKELVVCGGTASLHAVPLPKEIRHQFQGEWEVVALQTSPEDVWTAGVNFVGVKFDHGHSADTLVHHLPFGIVTIRWAIYRLFPLRADGSEMEEGEEAWLLERDGTEDQRDQWWQAGKTDREEEGETQKQQPQQQDAQPRGPTRRYRRVLVDHDTVRVLVLTENMLSDKVVTLSDEAEVLTTSSTVNWVVEADPTQAVRLRGEPLLNYSYLHYTSSSSSSTGGGQTTLDELQERFPYLGAQPRPGTGLLLVDKLPVGTIRLGYDLQPSKNAFGPMLGHKCSLRGVLSIERVSAFFSAQTAMDHECDGYTGNGQVTLCLHGEPPVPTIDRRRSQQRRFSHVRLVPLTRLEAIAKQGARELVEQRGCSTPWWVWPQTRWGRLVPVEREGLPPGRCVRFTVTADRHLAPREVSHPLFQSLPPPAGDPGVCRDFLSRRLIEGAALYGEAETHHGRGSFFSLRQARREGPVTYLPVLDAVTLQRLNTTMRPMVGRQGLADEVSTELNVTRGGEAVVTLRMDLSQPRQLGGFPLQEGLRQAPSAHSDLFFNTSHTAVSPLMPMLLRCAEGRLRAGDVLQYWTETNRPEGAVDRTAEEWLSYVHATAPLPIACEVLFSSQEHLLVPPAAGAQTDSRGRRRRQQQQHVVVVDSHLPAPLVSLEEMEAQVDALRAAHRVTKDGIHIEGLRPPLQEALRRRRITVQQLHEIERARAASKAAAEREEAAQQQQRGHLGLEKAPSGMTRRERLLAALRAYHATSPETEVVALRVRLPAHEAFAVPYDLFLRTALHKDVVCGTRVAPPPPVLPAAPAAVPNPHALVTFARAVILDVPPVVAPVPPVKQCEVEGHLPLLTVAVEGGAFAAADGFAADRVELEEVQNPSLPPLAETAARGVGLRPCLSDLRRGLQASVAATTRKQLYLQLGHCPTFQMLTPEEYDERQDSEALLRRLAHPRYLRVTIRGALRPDNFTTYVRGVPQTDVSVVVEVRPTIAQLHLHTGAQLGRSDWQYQLSSGFAATPQRPLLLCEADLLEHGFELGVGLVGDQWTLTQDPATGAPASQPPADTRAGQNPRVTALLNSFSVVEHHGLESTHHLYLKGGGVYRSHFVHYFYSRVLSDERLVREHSFVHYYNDSFIALRVPPQPADPSRRTGGTPRWSAAARRAEERQQWASLPAVRTFSKVEEILFAVPGLATACEGCLLADTTFFVAGDLTVRWTHSPRSLVLPSASVLPPENALAPRPLDHTALAQPLLVRWDSAAVVPRTWALHWLCQHGAARALQRFAAAWRPPAVPRAGAPYLEMEVLLYALRDAAGVELPYTHRPTPLLRSQPLLVSQVLPALQDVTLTSTAAPLLSVVLPVGEREAAAAFTTLAADTLHYRRHPSHASFGYTRAAATDGLLAVNATVALRLCVPRTGGSTHARATLAEEEDEKGEAATVCTVVSLTDALLTVEAPRPPPRQGWWGRLRGRLSTTANSTLLHRHYEQHPVRRNATDAAAATETRRRTSSFIFFELQNGFHLYDVAHHVLLAVLCFNVLPFTGVLAALAPAHEGGRGDGVWMESSVLHSRHQARVVLALCFFVVLVVTYAYVEAVWLVLWAVLWVVANYSSTEESRLRVWVEFVGSALYWYFIMT